MILDIVDRDGTRRWLIECMVSTAAKMKPQAPDNRYCFLVVVRDKVTKPMFGGSGDAWRGYWYIRSPSVPCRAAAGKQCLCRNAYT